MDQETYNLYRLAKYIGDNEPVKRSVITRNGIGHAIYPNMVELNKAMDYLTDNKHIKSSVVDVPGRNGRAPLMISLTASGKKFVKDKFKEWEKAVAMVK